MEVGRCRRRFRGRSWRTCSRTRRFARMRARTFLTRGASTCSGRDWSWPSSAHRFWPSSAHRLRLSLLPALSVRGRPPTGRPPPAGGNGSTTQDRESISLPVALIPARGFSHKTHLSGARFRLDPYAREVDWARPGGWGRRRVNPRTPHPAGDQGRHKQMIDPVAEPGEAAHASPPAVRRDQRHRTRRRSLRRRLLERSARRARDPRLRWRRPDGPCRSPPATSHLSVTPPAEGLMRRLVDASRVRIPCTRP